MGKKLFLPLPSPPMMTMIPQMKTHNNDDMGWQELERVQRWMHQLVEVSTEPMAWVSSVPNLADTSSYLKWPELGFFQSHHHCLVGPLSAHDNGCLMYLQQQTLSATRCMKSVIFYSNNIWSFVNEI